MLVRRGQKREKQKNHKTADKDIKRHQISHALISKLECHYLRANSRRELIDGRKSFVNIHRYNIKNCQENNSLFGNYTQFYRVFIEEFTPN